MRDRSRIHPPAVALPVAHPSDLGFCWHLDGADALGSDSWGVAVSWPAAGPLLWGISVQGHPSAQGNTRPQQGSGQHQGPSIQPIWPRRGLPPGRWRGWLRQRPRAPTPGAPSAIPRQGRHRDASRGAQRKEGSCSGPVGEDVEGSGRRTTPQGERERGDKEGDVCPNGCGTYVPRGAPTVVERCSQVFIKMRTYVPMGRGTYVPQVFPRKHHSRSWHGSPNPEPVSNPNDAVYVALAGELGGSVVTLDA